MPTCSVESDSGSDNDVVIISVEPAAGNVTRYCLGASILISFDGADVELTATYLTLHNTTLAHA